VESFTVAAEDVAGMTSAELQASLRRALQTLTQYKRSRDKLLSELDLQARELERLHAENESVTLAVQVSNLVLHRCLGSDHRNRAIALRPGGRLCSAMLADAFDHAGSGGEH
jgi:hypothetical protein